MTPENRSPYRFSMSAVICVSDKARQWVAHFKSSPDITFDGNVPMNAVARLLEETGAELGLCFPFSCEKIEPMPDVACMAVERAPPNVIRHEWKTRPFWLPDDFPTAYI